jgi:catalase
MLNPPASFAGRKVGVMVADGASAMLLNALRQGLTDVGATLEIVAPKIGGIDVDDGAHVNADQTIKGAPSVLFDAVVLLLSTNAVPQFLDDPAVRDFIADAFAHSKFVAFDPAARPLLEAALGDYDFDAGFIEFKAAGDVAAFLKSCRALRFWARQPK